MKKNFLTVAAMSIAAFFAATEIAKAADVTFSGQIRTRWEAAGHNNAGGAAGQTTAGTNAFNDGTDPDDFTASRVRLNANVNVNDSTSAFIQMQSVRTWGAASAGAAGTNAGTGNASATVSDGDATVGLHQAYFTLKNFANLPIAMDAKIGRQEVVLDGHRLFGNTGWTTGAQTHDAVRLTHAHDNMSLNLAYIIAGEDGLTNDPNDSNDLEVYLAHFNYKGVLGGQFSAIYAFVDNGCGAAGVAGAAQACTTANNDLHTIGARQAGQLFGIDYRGEFYYQFGEANATAAALGLATSAAIPEYDRDAYMFGVRVGKTFNNVMFKPGITIWYDYLSGTSDADAANGDFKTFNTLFDTGHKFYGYMDLFLAVGTGSSGGTRGLGLQDFAIKTKLEPMPGWTLKLDAHAFLTAEGVGANSTVSGVPQGAVSGVNQGNNTKSFLGQEFDVTLVHKYNANTNISFGYSTFNGTEAFTSLRNGTTTLAGVANNADAVVGSDSADWAYVQFDVKF